MKNNIDPKKFDDILNDCLERLLAGSTVEQCLSDYPGYAADLEPLLRTAAAIERASAVEPSTRFRESSRRGFLMALRDTKEANRRRFALWHPRWATVLVAVIIMLLAGGSTVAAAQQAMPDHPLYPVKIASENAQLALTRSRTDKAELAARLADKRVKEIIAMADKGKTEQVLKATERLDAALGQVTRLTAERNAAARATTAPAIAPAVAPAPALAPAPAATLKPAPTPATAPRKAALQTPVATATPKPAVPPPSPTRTPTITAAPAGKADQGKAATKTEKEAIAKKNSQTVRPARTASAAAQERRAKLKETLTRKARENPAALRALIRQAPAAMKPALERALEIAEKRYRQALDNLDNDKKQ